MIGPRHAGSRLWGFGAVPSGTGHNYQRNSFRSETGRGIRPCNGYIAKMCGSTPVPNTKGQNDDRLLTTGASIESERRIPARIFHQTCAGFVEVVADGIANKKNHWVLRPSTFRNGRHLLNYTSRYQVKGGNKDCAYSCSKRIALFAPVAHQPAISPAKWLFDASQACI